MSILITLIVVLAILAIGWWALNQLPLPQPFRIVAVVIVALVAIVLLMQLLPGGRLVL